MGENGAGKSTLIKIVAGVYRRDAGELLLDGEPVHFGSTAESKDSGLAVNYQENAARIRPFLERMRLDLTVVRDHDGSVRDAWDVNVFPTTFVVNPNQRIALVAVGEIDWDDAQVEARIRELGGRPRTVAERR